MEGRKWKSALERKEGQHVRELRGGNVGGGGIDNGMKIDQNVSEYSGAEEGGKTQGGAIESHSNCSEKHIDGDEGLGWVSQQ